MISEDFMEFLKDKKNESLMRAKRLTADDRRDDANQCKIEANIYDVFATLYQMSWQQAGLDAARVDELFREKARTIPDNWRMALESARQHNDTAKILAGETKMAVVELIMRKYDELAGQH